MTIFAHVGCDYPLHNGVKNLSAVFLRFSFGNRRAKPWPVFLNIYGKYSLHGGPKINIFRMKFLEILRNCKDVEMRL